MHINRFIAASSDSVWVIQFYLHSVWCCIAIYSRIAGGSSGGEAALMATGATVVSVGSDLAGSIRIPALFCGLYGHKTSPHVVPLEGMYPSVEPERQHMLSYGPISRYAKDLLPSLKMMAGKEGSARLRLDEPVNLSKVKVCR